MIKHQAEYHREAMEELGARKVVICYRRCGYGENAMNTRSSQLARTLQDGSSVSY